MRTAVQAAVLAVLIVVVGVPVLICAGNAVVSAWARSARDRAREISCRSNVRQIETAMLSYTQDYDEVLPPPALQPRSGDPPSWAPIWPAFVMPYVKNMEIFVCPSTDAGRYVDTWGSRGRLSYGLSRDVEASLGSQPGAWRKVAEPERVIWLADSSPGETAAPYNMRGFEVAGDRPPDTAEGIGERHRGGTNVGFLDGHAQWYRSSAIWQVRNSAGLLWRP